MLALLIEGYYSSLKSSKEVVYMISLIPEKGQGLVEYALILVLVAVIVLVVLLALGPIIGDVFSEIIGVLSGISPSN